jgi:glycosyltransferase involved in cell wall biosynthesis
VRLSILVPLYNEEEWIAEALERVIHAQLPDNLEREVIVVDDGSTDGSANEVERLRQRYPSVVRLLRHEINSGKGAALQTAIKHATGELSIFQDADLEYSPTDYPHLLRPLLAGIADAVYGSRFLAVEERRVLYYWHSVANKALTGLCNMVSGLNLTDMETCYKAFRTSLLKSIPIRCRRFGIEPEITIKLAQRRARVFETPVSYYGRTYDEGKKIGLKDAFRAVGVMIRFGLFTDVYYDRGPEILDVLSNAPRFNRWMADTIRPYLGPRTLELGAGIGNLSIQLIRGRQQYLATDIDEEHLSRLRTRLQFRRNVAVGHCDLTVPADFERLKESFDSVVCLNVLEHIENDRLGLSNIRSVLVTGGRAIILVPEGMSVYGTLDEVLGHFRRYSEAELRSKLEQSGFRVEQILRFNKVTRPAWFVNGRLLRKRTFSRFQIAVFDSLVWLWRRLDAVIPWKPTSIIAVAVKRADEQQREF